MSLVAVTNGSAPRRKCYLKNFTMEAMNIGYCIRLYLPHLRLWHYPNLQAMRNAVFVMLKEQNPEKLNTIVIVITNNADQTMKEENVVMGVGIQLLSVRFQVGRVLTTDILLDSHVNLNL